MPNVLWDLLEGGIKKKKKKKKKTVRTCAGVTLAFTPFMINLPEIRTHSLQQQSGAQSEVQAAAQSGAKSEAQAEAQP